MKDLKVESFITGNADLFGVVRQYPALRMVPIDHADIVRTGLKRLGYNFRIRYRGPHGPQHDTLKQNARAFTAYIYEAVE
jgi:hypothetical protein